MLASRARTPVNSPSAPENAMESSASQHTDGVELIPTRK